MDIFGYIRVSYLDTYMIYILYTTQSGSYISIYVRHSASYIAHMSAS